MSRRTKPRNGHACHPIMRKGGVHEKSKGAKRAAAKRETRQKAGEWLGRSSVNPVSIDTGRSAANALLYSGQIYLPAVAA